MTQAPSPISGLAERLLPCPFCASKARLHDYGYTQGTDNAFVECETCGVSLEGDGGTPADAVSAWNRRALAPPLPVAAQGGVTPLKWKKRRGIEGLKAHSVCGLYEVGEVHGRIFSLLRTIDSDGQWQDIEIARCASVAAAKSAAQADFARRIEASISKTAAPLGVEPEFGTAVSEETQAALKAIDDGQRAAAAYIAANPPLFGHGDAALPIPAPDAQVVAVPTVVREAAEFTREDLGPNGTSYPHIRAMLSFIEGLIATPVTGEADVGGRLADSVDKAEAWDMLAAKSATIVELRSRVEALTAEVGTAKAEAFEEAAQIADGWEHTRAGQEIADAIRSRAVKGAGQS